MIQSDITINNNQLDDQVLLKSDGYPTYHLANVVDDYMMKISHVIRGSEWLNSTPKHILLFRMLDIEPPKYAHVPLLVNSKGAKLSKRHGDVTVKSYINKGYLPEAMINGLALLGWNPPHYGDTNALLGSVEEFMDRDIMLLDDLDFDLKHVGRAPCRFSEDKFKYFNQQHIRRKFEYYNPDERKDTTVRFRKILLKLFQDQPSDQGIIIIFEFAFDKCAF